MALRDVRRGIEVLNVMRMFTKSSDMGCNDRSNEDKIKTETNDGAIRYEQNHHC